MIGPWMGSSASTQTVVDEYHLSTMEATTFERAEGRRQDDRELWRTYLVAILVGSTVVRLVLSWTYLGFVSGDDVEILEEGLNPVLDLNYQPWEIRNLLLPRLLVTPIGWLAEHFGISDPTLLVRLAHLPFIALSTLNVYLVYRIVRRGAPPCVGVLAAGIYSFHWLPLGFGATVFPRTASSTCILLAFLVLLGGDHDLARGGGAGILVALAFAFRYSEGIYLAPLALVPWVLSVGLRRSLVRGLALTGGFLVGVFVFVGLFDLWTWKEPFGSLVEFARYTLVEGRASKLRPVQPPLWYLFRAQFWLIPSLIPFLVVRKRDARVPAFWLVVILPILVLSLIHHKEMRYLQGVIPFLAILVALGAGRLWERSWRKTTVVLLMVSGLFSLRTALDLHREKSLAAVQAALDLRDEARRGQLVVTQAWAYGDRLFLGHSARLVNFETPPTAGELDSALDGASHAAFYEEDLQRRPKLLTVLTRKGFEATRRYDEAKSRPVTVLWRPETESERPRTSPDGPPGDVRKSGTKGSDLS